ncbi:hypothetical protein [Oceanobacillus senegalensis]|uniref:hypothetical protein n=1 Tax=Oceanobacillus senegalensis TaxID=1936063 RepID=UPI000A30861B|nr:hypothetical protein [Oceanobacillus senegalensis]
MYHLEPMKNGSLLTVKDWEKVTPYDNKFELWDGIAFDPESKQRDTLCLALVYNMGLQHLIDILPYSSKQTLRE